MPPGTPYNSFIVPYPIRVDEFSVPRDGSLTVAALHLLTHTHSDHIIGLDAKSFGSVVVCSKDAKEMLLRHESYLARSLKEQEVYLERIRTFSHLKTSSQQVDLVAHNDPHAYDLLRDLPLNTPTRIEISNDEWVTITLVDANHCPGSVMFLIEGSKGAILHTGDFRAEPMFINSVIESPYLKPYLAFSGIGDPSSSNVKQKTLEAIYLDTASMYRMCAVPTKEEATSALVDLVLKYPSTTRFFINTWTWGYEDILVAIFKSFETKIHVDRYKYEVYKNLSNSDLRELVTQDPKATRFHACERFDRCDVVSFNDPTVVYVNPVSMGTENWLLYLAQTRMSIKRGELPTYLLVPLHRHSPLSELQKFVGLFRPKRLVPNFLHPLLKGIDWACMPQMFGPYMSEGGAERIRKEMAASITVDGISKLDAGLEIEDSEVSNLEGGNAVDELSAVVGVWTSAPGDEGARSTAGRLIHRLRKFLPKGISVLIDRVLRDARMKVLPQVYASPTVDDTDTSDEDEDATRRTAELLFGDHFNYRRSSESQTHSPGSVNSVISLSNRQRKGHALLQQQELKRNENPESIEASIDSGSGHGVHQASESREDEKTLEVSFMIPATQGMSEERPPSLGSPLRCIKPPRSGKKQSNSVRNTAYKAPLAVSDAANLLDRRDAKLATTNALTISNVDGFGLFSELQSYEVKTQNNSVISVASSSATSNRVRGKIDRSPTVIVSSAAQVCFKRYCSDGSRKRPLSPEPTYLVMEANRPSMSRDFNLSKKLSLARPDLITEEITSSIPCGKTDHRERRYTTTPSMKYVSARKSGAETHWVDDDCNSTTSSLQELELTSSAVASKPGKASVEDVEAPIDWERSRRLQRAVLDDLRRGRRPQLPALKFVVDGISEVG